MPKNVELEKVKVRIRALSEKTVVNGCTESEAFLAFEKIGELLEKYNLEMSEVDLRSEPCIQNFFECWSSGKTPVASVLTALARFSDVRVWMSPPQKWGNPTIKNMRYFFFGLESDVQMAVYLTDIIDKAISTELNKFKKTDVYKDAHNRKTSTHSFYMGITSRLAHRLNKMKNETEAAAQKRNLETQKLLGSNMTSLTVVKATIVDEAFKELGMRLRSTSSHRVIGDRSAFGAGDAAAGNVNLNRPLAGGGQSETKLLK